MEIKQILASFAEKTLNIPPEQFAELMFTKSDEGAEQLKPDALAVLLSRDAERISGIKSQFDTKGAFDNGYKKAQAEIAKRYETRLREKAGISDETVLGEDLIDAALEAVSKVKIDDEKVKLTPAYINRERELIKQAEEIKQSFEVKIREIEEGYKQKEIIGQVVSNARDLFLRLNPVLPEDQALAENQISYFLEQYKNRRYVADSGQFYMVDSEGKRIDDNHGNPQTLEKDVREKAAALFAFKKQPDAGNAGNKNDPGNAGQQPQGKYTGKVPATLEDFNKLYFSLEDAAARSDLAKQFKEAQAR